MRLYFFVKRLIDSLMLEKEESLYNANRFNLEIIFLFIILIILSLMRILISKLKILIYIFKSLRK